MTFKPYCLDHLKQAEDRIYSPTHEAGSRKSRRCGHMDSCIRPRRGHKAHRAITYFRVPAVSFNTGSFADTSEHRNQFDGALKEELLPSLRLDIPDFTHAVFGQISRLDELAEDVFDHVRMGKHCSTSKASVGLSGLQTQRRNLFWSGFKISRRVLRSGKSQGGGKPWGRWWASRR